MKKSVLLWIVAVAITLGAAVYQRMTGPTYPLRGSVTVAEQAHRYRLVRSHGGDEDARVELDLPGFEGQAILVYRRYKTGDAWTRVPMSPEGDKVVGALPHQPPAGKLEYFIELEHGGQKQALPKDRTVVIRFKGAVPAAFLAPHVLLMFLAMLLSNRAGLEALRNGPALGWMALGSASLLFLGGMIGGPIVQKFAFGAFWTGVPFGWDLTDNKTLFAMVGWGLAAWQARFRRGRSARWWVLGAALLLLAIYSIPHSTLGSELDYASGQVITGD